MNRKLVVLLAALLGICWLAPGAGAEPSDATRPAVFEPETKGVDLSLAASLALRSLLAAELQTVGKLKPIPEDAMYRAQLDLTRELYQRCTTAPCQTKLVGALQATHLANATVLRKRAKRCLVRVVFRSIAPKEPKKSSEAEGSCDPSGIALAMQDAARKTMGQDAAASAVAAAPSAATTSFPAMQIVPDKDQSPMVLVPGGPFLRGSALRGAASDERPAAIVSLRSFYIDQRAITAAQYQLCVDASACSAPGGWRDCSGTKRTMESARNCVDWSQADAYCRWAGERLPSEAEWEKAVRGIDGRPYLCGSNKQGQCTRSPFSVYPLASEWVADWYDEASYRASPPRRRPGTHRAVRGVPSPSDRERLGGRVTARARLLPTSRDTDLGFRCVRETPR